MAHSDLGSAPMFFQNHPMLHRRPQVAPAINSAHFAPPQAEDGFCVFRGMKGPEPDRFTVEFFRATCDIIGPALHNIIRQFFVNEVLTDFFGEVA